MEFTPRLTRPEAGNKYYIRVASGGYSTAILGKPVDKDCDVLSNCVGFAVGRFHEIANCPEFNLIMPVNAENIFANAKAHGLKTGSEPKLGAIIVWAKGKIGDSSDGAGHVAVVEQINADGSIVTSESGYGAKNPFWTTQRYKKSGNWGQSADYTFVGFVYQPDGDTNPYPEPKRALKKGAIGSDVKWMQYELIESGYLRENELDGAFGTITLGALLAFQFEHALEVDGVCGAKTRTVMKEVY